MCEPFMNAVTQRPLAFPQTNCRGDSSRLVSGELYPASSARSSIVVPDGWTIQFNGDASIKGPYVSEDTAGITSFQLTEPADADNARAFCLGAVSTSFGRVDTGARKSPAECDEIFIKYCVGERLRTAPECACFKESADPAAPRPASCFGESCRKGDAYQLSTEPCTTTICQDSADAAGTTINCGNHLAVPAQVRTPVSPWRGWLALGWIWLLGAAVLGVALLLVLVLVRR
jgi:hypothetical protein